jgi:hypothetical protein
MGRQCADITFSSNAPPGDLNLCQNSTGVSGAFIMNALAVGSAGGSNSSSTKASSTVRGSVPVTLLVGIAGLVAVGSVYIESG